MNLSLKKDTRSYFLDDRVRQGLIEYEDLSVKTLTNIENGYNLPSLSTLKILSTALEIDFFQLDRKSTRLNSSHSGESRMPSSA